MSRYRTCIGYMWFFLTLLIALTLGRVDASKQSVLGCSLYGTCGRRADGDPLPCASPQTPPVTLPDDSLRKLQRLCPALPPGPVCCSPDQVDTLARSLATGLMFLSSCPACASNFQSLFCALTCSPNQAAFARVTATQPGDAGVNGTVKTAVAELDFFVAPEFAQALFDACDHVVYPSLNMRSLDIVGGGATTAQQFLEFLGLQKDQRVPPAGSPFQINFPEPPAWPADLAAPLNDTLPGCGDPAYLCSCGDCPAARGCAAPGPDDSAARRRARVRAEERRTRNGASGCAIWTCLHLCVYMRVCL